VALVLASAAPLGCSLGQPVNPGCSPEDSLYTLVLTAESVRSASLVPCLRPLQPGWEIDLLDARNDRSRFVLSSDRGGENALTIDLIHRCDVRNASRVPSDEPGTARYEEISRLEPGYVGTRSYVFPGGCVRFRFDLETELASGLLNEASLMVGFVSRDAISEELETKTRIHVEDGP
jgi:hypothetical protein